MSIEVEYPTEWKEYELLDFGQGAKFERFGPEEDGYTVVRPDPRAVWEKTLPEESWGNADANFTRTDPRTGVWTLKRNPPSPWHIHYKHLTFILRPTEFKHVGIFPEQAVNWEWLTKTINSKPLSVLNLFAYTGGATMASLAAGAKVTHVDAAKSTISWAKENLAASGLSEKPVRFIEDDAFKFVSREIKRGNTYDGIILDPPRFGRGSKGEIWKLETDLPKLLSVCKQILSKTPAFVLINAYTADISSLVLDHLLSDMTHDLGGTREFGELTLKDSASEKLLPSGILARWTAA
jgi:23S rRNA (cytosine1962-C5)-methyltransferase